MKQNFMQEERVDQRFRKNKKKKRTKDYIKPILKEKIGPSILMQATGNFCPPTMLFQNSDPKNKRRAKRKVQQDEDSEEFEF